MCGQYCVFLLLEKYLANRKTIDADNILDKTLKGYLYEWM